jgi:hypothetical protein
MSDQRADINVWGLFSLQSAIGEYAKSEIFRLTDELVDELRSRPAVGLFGDVAVRHLWDEYRWNLIEGPFDDDSYIGGFNTGSISGNFDDIIEAWLNEAVEKLPQYAQVFLTSHANAESEDEFHDAIEAIEAIGSIDIDIVVALVVGQVQQRGLAGNLDMIGPYRTDIIASELVPQGMVWSTLNDRREAFEIISGFTSEILDPEGDLSELVEEMVDAFIAAAGQDGNDVVDALLAYSGDELRTLAAADALASFEDARAALHAQIDN